MRALRDQIPLPGFEEVKKFMSEDPQYRPDLDADPGSLDEEIRLLRFMVRESMRKLAGTPQEKDIRLWTNLLNAVSATTARLTVLLKAQHALQPSGTDAIAAALVLALEEFDEEQKQLEPGEE